ncbi:hypothetical protein ACOYQJ_11095 [Primorskyibacter sp. 2E233]
MTLLTFAILGVSVLLVICGLRTLAQDTYQTIALATERARKAGALIPRASFATLWLMIFALSYM